MSARTQDVQLALQCALDSLHDRTRRPGEPEIVHDQGPQYISREWLAFVQHTAMTDVKIRAHHPQSNGRVERFHRTVREEVPLDPDDLLHAVQDRLAEYRLYYNERRPHSALQYLRPIDYYRGDPKARLAERETKLQHAASSRIAFWQSHP